jgi:predicted NUDIX family NTP pyrophosphohydrolase
MCRKNQNDLEFFLIHPGGPFYKNKNEGVWSIPKGMTEADEELLSAAKREFQEETGIISQEPYYSLGTAKMKSGKVIHVWGFIGEWDPDSGIESNTFKLEWPPKSGKLIDIPEADRANWFSFEDARKMIHPNQLVFLERMLDQQVSQR